MAKVTLITSRDIKFKFLDERIPYCKKYRELFKKKEDDGGLVYCICNNLYGKSDYDGLQEKEKTPEKVAQLIIPTKGKRFDFYPGVYKKGFDDMVYYFAYEYPYYDDKPRYKYMYLDALLEMIFENNNNNKIDEFNVFSHDEDWGFHTTDKKISKDFKENIKDYACLDKLFEEFIVKEIGEILLFQHSNSSNIYNTKVKTILQMLNN